jgi:hypothetical protein
MVIPYTCEASLSQALEPSLLYHFYADTAQLVVEDHEDVEPTHIQIDTHCLDRYKGPEKFAARKSEAAEESTLDAGESKMSRYSRVSAKNLKGQS